MGISANIIQTQTISKYHRVGKKIMMTYIHKAKKRRKKSSIKKAKAATTTKERKDNWTTV
jgi:hypothetical protein